MSEPNRKIDIFCSLRFNQTGPIKEAKLVKDLLEKEGLNACIIDTEIGGSILAEVVEKLNECKVVILFANEDYGVDTGCLFSSRYELLWVLDNKKPFFFIKMCDSFLDNQTSFPCLVQLRQCFGILVKKFHLI